MVLSDRIAGRVLALCLLGAVAACGTTEDRLVTTASVASPGAASPALVSPAVAGPGAVRPGPDPSPEAATCLEGAGALGGVAGAPGPPTGAVPVEALPGQPGSGALLGPAPAVAPPAPPGAGSSGFGVLDGDLTGAGDDLTGGGATDGPADGLSEDERRAYGLVADAPVAGAPGGAGSGSLGAGGSDLTAVPGDMVSVDAAPGDAAPGDAVPGGAGCDAPADAREPVPAELHAPLPR